jgi:hypothetical protein
MKQLLFALILSVYLCNSLFAQEQKVTITYTWTRIQSHGSNQIAVWIEDTLGNYISTVFATRFTAKGGYIRRPVSLSEWTSKFDLKKATKEQVDAISGSTPQSGRQSVTWNCKDMKGNIVPEGIYVVRMEANIHDMDKMFFRCKIILGGCFQPSSGEITFSRPELASGEVLFKDVLVESKLVY